MYSVSIVWSAFASIHFLSLDHTHFLSTHKTDHAPPCDPLQVLLIGQVWMTDSRLHFLSETTFAVDVFGTKVFLCVEEVTFLWSQSQCMFLHSFHYQSEPTMSVLWCNCDIPGAIIMISLCFCSLASWQYAVEMSRSTRRTLSPAPSM